MQILRDTSKKYEAYSVLMEIIKENKIDKVMSHKYGSLYEAPENNVLPMLDEELVILKKLLSFSVTGVPLGIDYQKGLI